MRILGLDPGSRYTGYGIVEKKGNTLSHICSGRINATKEETFAQRLAVLHTGLHDLLTEYSCDVAAVERVFAGKNINSTIKLSHARGVLLLATAQFELELFEYAPTKVKQIVTGKGRAAKDDVAHFTKRLLGIHGDLAEDASDALAVAICHSQLERVNSRLVSNQT